MTMAASRTGSFATLVRKVAKLAPLSMHCIKVSRLEDDRLALFYRRDRAWPRWRKCSQMDWMTFHLSSIIKFYKIHAIDICFTNDMVSLNYLFRSKILGGR